MQAANMQAVTVLLGNEGSMDDHHQMYEYTMLEELEDHDGYEGGQQYEQQYTDRCSIFSLEGSAPSGSCWAPTEMDTNQYEDEHADFHFSEDNGQHSDASSDQNIERHQSHDSLRNRRRGHDHPELHIEAPHAGQQPAPNEAERMLFGACGDFDEHDNDEARASQPMAVKLDAQQARARPRGPSTPSSAAPPPPASQPPPDAPATPTVQAPPPPADQALTPHEAPAPQYLKDEAPPSGQSSLPSEDQAIQ